MWTRVLVGRLSALGTAVESPEPHCEEERRSNGEDLERMARRRGFASRNAQTTYAFATTSPAFLRCVFLAFRILQLTTLYSGHMASESLTLLVIMFSIISGKWKVQLRMTHRSFIKNQCQLRTLLGVAILRP